LLGNPSASKSLLEPAGYGGYSAAPKINDYNSGSGYGYNKSGLSNNYGYNSGLGAGYSSNPWPNNKLGGGYGSGLGSNPWPKQNGIKNDIAPILPPLGSPKIGGPHDLLNVKNFDNSKLLVKSPNPEPEYVEPSAKPPVEAPLVEAAAEEIE